MEEFKESINKHDKFVESAIKAFLAMPLQKQKEALEIVSLGLMALHDFGMIAMINEERPNIDLKRGDLAALMLKISYDCGKLLGLDYKKEDE